MALRWWAEQGTGGRVGRVTEGKPQCALRFALRGHLLYKLNDKRTFQYLSRYLLNLTKTFLRPDAFRQPPGRNQRNETTDQTG